MNYLEIGKVCDVLAQSNTIIDVLRDSDKENPMVSHPFAPLVADDLNRVMEFYNGKIMSMAIFDVESDGMLLNTGEGSDECFSFRERPYYEPVLTQKYKVTEPYLDILTKGLVVTVASPVIDRGEVLGVVGLDLPIDFLSHLVMESSYGETGRSLVMDNNGIILAYADPSYINQHYSDLKITGEDLEIELKSPSGKLSKTMFQLNNVDTLTGLYNRSGYSHKLDEIMDADPSTMGVISVNVNGIKQINEEFGSEVGDKYIKESGTRLKENLSFQVFRMGGDEFIGLAPNIEKDDFENQITTLTKTMRVEENYDFAIGHAWSKGKIDLIKLTFEADTVMYINKQEFYAKGNRTLTNIQDSVLADLLKYLVEDEFMIYLQPQVLLKDATLYGAEALIRRFDKSNQKMVFPDQFISLYEQKSVIRHVDFFVIESVCKCCSGGEMPGKPFLFL